MQVGAGPWALHVGWACPLHAERAQVEVSNEAVVYHAVCPTAPSYCAPGAGPAYDHTALGPFTGTYVGCMFGDYMSLLRVALQQRHTGPVMTGVPAAFSNATIAASSIATAAGAAAAAVLLRRVHVYTLPCILPHLYAGNGAPYQSGRVAYAFNLQGPCNGIDTACSSSLVAAHNAHRGRFLLGVYRLAVHRMPAALSRCFTMLHTATYLSNVHCSLPCLQEFWVARRQQPWLPASM